MRQSRMGCAASRREDAPLLDWGEIDGGQEMLKIAVCDDEAVFLNKLCGIIAQYLEGRKVDYAIDVFASGKEFVSDSTDITKYNIVFLDVNMAEMDGNTDCKAVPIIVS